MTISALSFMSTTSSALRSPPGLAVKYTASGLASASIAEIVEPNVPFRMRSFAKSVGMETVMSIRKIGYLEFL